MSEQMQSISSTTQKNWQYWQQKLSGTLPAIELPSDRLRTPTVNSSYASYSFKLKTELVEQLEQLSVRQETPLETVLLAAFKIFLYRYTNQEDMVVFAPNLAKTENNATPVILRSSLAKDLSFTDYLATVRQTVLEAFTHREYDFELLKDKLLSVQDWSYFRVWFDVREESAIELKSNEFDLCLEIAHSKILSVNFKYNSDLFDRSTIERMARHWQTLVEQILATPDRAISRLPLLLPAEQEQLLQNWNQTQVAYPSDKLIHQLFEERVKENPSAVAVVFEEQEVSYGELNRRANQLAHYLQSLGVKPEVLVGICIERSVEMVVGLLGIIKAGGAYVPCDPNLPEERLSYMLNDSGVEVLLSQKSLVAALPSHNAKVICLDSDRAEIEAYSPENLDIDIDANNLAYVIYTSGSTGKPKGVMNTHFGIHNRLRWMQAEYQLNSSDRVVQKTPFSFDVSVWEFFWTLMTGATIVVARPEGHKDSNYLANLIAQQQITTMHFVPSMLQVFLQEPNLERCSSLKRVFCSGEALPYELTQRFFSQLNCELHNLYGPTEAAIDVTYWQCQPQNDSNIVPIGRPIANTQTYILDEHFEPVPIGVLGELYLGGDNLARGYLNRPELTQEKFIINPLANTPSPRLYKTGDLARYRSDGNIEFLGRIDHQVKLRGFRIELGEIEAVLDAHPQVQQSVVLASDDLTGNKRLVAYLASSETLSSDRLREHLLAKLPEYMVPSIFITLDAIPLTPNGKVDRRALPAPDIRQAMEKSYQAPSTVREQSLADIWKSVLNLEKVGVEDNFFELGGNSILAMQVIAQMRSQLGIDLALDAIFNAPTIAKLAQTIELQATSEQKVTIQPIERNKELSLSSSERSLWFFEKLNPQTAVYNIPLVFKLKGAVNIEVLEQSLNRIVQRHEIFRTAYPEVNGQPQKVIATELAIKLAVFELSDTSEAEAWATREAKQPFDLAKEPLLRAILLSLESDEYWLVVTCHHIVFDGWSIKILFDELAGYYDALINNSAVNLEDLTVQYVDYAHWQQQWLQSEEYTKQLDYWRKQLEGSAPLMELPTDRSRPAVQTYLGDRHYFQLTPELTQALNALSRQEGVTLFMTLLAAFKVLLYRYTGQSDVIVGSPFANRNTANTEQLIGFFVNTLVLRTNLGDDLSFRELLSRILETTSGAYAHANLPFEKLVEELQPERNLSYNPIFQVMFALQKQLPTAQSLSGLTWEVEEKGTGSSMFDLTLDAIETPTGIAGYFEYNSNLFDRDTIARMNAHWQTLLEGIVTNPKAQIAYLPLLTPAEQQTLIDWNQLWVNKTDKSKDVRQLFEAQVERTPDAIAVEFDGRQLTYRQLNQKVNQLAHYLQTLGVGAEVLVGICVERSLEMIIGLLGIFKAGGAYVPLDPNYPQDRLAYMVADSQIAVLLTQAKWQAHLPETQAQIVNLDSDWEQISNYSTENTVINITTDNLAYVIYTSGSTGKPKGVMITHQGLSCFSQSAIRRYRFTSSDRILQFASINFDAAVEQIFPGLCVGATIVLRTDAMLTDLKTFFSICENLALTVLGFTTSYWHQLAAELTAKDISFPESLRLVIIGGEAVMPEPVKRWQKKVIESGKRNRLELVNSYGPTEATVVTTSYTIPADNSLKGEVPIGRPWGHLQTYILDRHLQLVPIGVPGELHVGGDSLARGYLNRSDLTAAKFIPNPFSEEANARMYKTGDLARYLPNGEIEYLGRIDNQVKIRGFRIELGEIEAILTQHPNISEAAIIVSEDSTYGKRLIAYLVSRSEKLQTKEVRAFLQERLPKYMVPSGFMFLKSMPLTPNNKLDRRALPAPDISRDDTEIAKPTNDVEQKLVEIWSNTLGIHPIGIQDNFFELGGHSLLAVKLFGEIERQFDRKLPLASLFEAPTIEQLALMLQTPQKTTSFDSVVKLKEGTTPPLFLVHDADGETILYLNLAQHLKPEQTVYGLRPYSQAGSPFLHTRLSEIVAHYVREIRKVQPQGPYAIGGLCAGGVLAFEIACQLQAEGEQVPLVAIIDAINLQGIEQDNFSSVNQVRKQNFLKLIDSKQETNKLKFVTNILKVLPRKVFNLVTYEISSKSEQFTDNLRIKLLRYCLDRQLTIPRFCQNIPLRSIYAYAESDYQPSVYQGQLTLWRATEKLELDNPAIDDTPAILEVKDPLLGWGKQATNGVAAHDIPGGHSSMLQEPHVRVMAEKLQPYLDAILNE
nr:non-ribosomal peptide synthetase [Myxosarcina sp. GI1]